MTKRPNGATARYRGSVTGGINGTVTSHEARGVGAVGLTCLESPSSPGSIGRANKKRAGHARGRDAGDQANATESRGRFSFLARAFVYFWTLAAAIAICEGTFGINGGLMGRILICGGDVACSESVPSVTVALHVTKRQNGATARYRGSVTGGINGTVTSHEARGVGAVG